MAARASSVVLVLFLAFLTMVFLSPVLALKLPSAAGRRRLNIPDPSYRSSPSSGSSPVSSSPSPVTSSPSSSSSPDVSPPYTGGGSPSGGSTPSSSSPVTSSPSTGSSPDVSPPYTGGSGPSGGSTPSSSSPPVSNPAPVTSTPSPVTIPPVTASPTGGYGGYGSHTGCGTSGFFRNKPGSVPRILSLVSTLAKLFGPRLLKLFSGGGAKPPTLLGALKDTSPQPLPSLFREGSASLINSYAHNDFPLTTSQVISQFNDALESPELAAQQALKFQQLNEGV